MSVFCGQCTLEFETPELELDHVCGVTGFKPTDPRSMGPNWAEISTAAIERGAEESTPEKVEAALAELQVTEE